MDQLVTSENADLAAHECLVPEFSDLCRELDLDEQDILNWLDLADEFRLVTTQANQWVEKQLSRLCDNPHLFSPQAREDFPLMSLGLEKFLNTFSERRQALTFSDTEIIQFLDKQQASWQQPLSDIFSSEAGAECTQAVLFLDPKPEENFNSLLLALRALKTAEVAYQPVNKRFQMVSSNPSKEEIEALAKFRAGLITSIPAVAKHPVARKNRDIRIGSTTETKAIEMCLKLAPDSISFPQDLGLLLPLAAGLANAPITSESPLHVIIYEAVNWALIFDTTSVKALTKQGYNLIFDVWLERAQKEHPEWFTSSDTLILSRIKALFNGNIKNMPPKLKALCKPTPTAPVVKVEVPARKPKKKNPARRKPERNRKVPVPKAVEEIAALPAPEFRDKDHFVDLYAQGRATLSLNSAPVDATHLFINTGKGANWQIKTIETSGNYAFRRPTYKAGNTYTLSVAYGRKGDSTPSGEHFQMTFTIPPHLEDPDISDPDHAKQEAQKLAKKEARELKWQNDFAEFLMSGVGNWDELFDSVEQQKNQITFTRSADSQNPEALSFTIQVNPLALIDPAQELRDEFLRDDVLPELIKWATGAEEIDEPSPEVITEGDGLALVLLEIQESSELTQAFIQDCLCRVSYNQETQTIGFTLEGLLHFFNKHNLLKPEDRSTVKAHWGGRSLELRIVAQECVCVSDPNTPLSADLCGLLIDILKDDWDSLLWPKIEAEQQAEKDRAEIEVFWEGKEALQDFLQSEIEFFRSFTPTQWQGHARYYDGENEQFLWEKQKYWDSLLASPEVAEFKARCLQHGILVKPTASANKKRVRTDIMFIFHPQNGSLTKGSKPSNQAFCGFAVYASKNNGSKNTKDILVNAPIGPEPTLEWEAEISRIGKRLFAALVNHVARAENTPMMAVKEREKEKTRKEQKSTIQSFEDKHERSLKPNSTEEFRVALYDEDGRLTGYENIGKLSDLEPGQKILLRDFVLQVGHEEAPTKDIKTPEALVGKVEDIVKHSLRGGFMQEVDANPSNTKAKSRQRRRAYGEVRELMTERNKRYLIKRMQATLVNKNKKKQPQETPSHKTPFHNYTAARILRKIIKQAGIKIADLMDSNLSSKDLLENYDIEGKCWVSGFIDALEKAEISLSKARERVLTYEEIQRIIGD